MQHVSITPLAPNEPLCLQYIGIRGTKPPCATIRPSSIGSIPSAIIMYIDHSNRCWHHQQLLQHIVRCLASDDGQTKDAHIMVCSREVQNTLDALDWSDTLHQNSSHSLVTPLNISQVVTYGTPLIGNVVTVWSNVALVTTIKPCVGLMWQTRGREQYFLKPVTPLYLSQATNKSKIKLKGLAKTTPLYLSQATYKDPN